MLKSCYVLLLEVSSRTAPCG